MANNDANDTTESYFKSSKKNVRPVCTWNRWWEFGKELIESTLDNTYFMRTKRGKCTRRVELFKCHYGRLAIKFAPLPCR